MMGKTRRTIAWVTGIMLVAAPGLARAAEALDALAALAAKNAIAHFQDDKVTEDALAITVIDLRDPAALRQGGFRGSEPIFPASVVKLFYLAATHQWLEEGKLQDSDELRRTMHDMIVDSSNDATGMIVDALSGAVNGAPLPDTEMMQWVDQRNAVNRYFASLGYAIGGGEGINVNQKTYCEGPYGREKLFIGPKFENRNKLTTGATARLLSEIVLGRLVSVERSKQMMDLLKRDPSQKASGADDQATGFIAAALPPGTKLWSKAGWTSTARHDAAYIETPGGVKAVIVIFTTGHARQRKLIPAVAREIIEGLSTAAAG